MTERKEFYRNKKEEKPVLAICYDFDKTLSPDNMQAQGYIQSVGYDVEDFWKESNSLAENNDMDQNLAYMFKMIQKAEGKLVFSRKALREYGAKVKLFKGVEEWFERIRQYGEDMGVIVEHYIISCGLKEMIEGTSVAQKGVFKKIYANSFYYNEEGIAVWPAQVINYTGKTQFLFRIEKGILDINDSGVNDPFEPENLRVPFRNMVYIGDSDTDIPCMKIVNSYGGHSIAVYDDETKDKSKVYKMLKDGRVKFFVPADYSDGAQIDVLVKAIIDRTAANEALENIHYECKKEKADCQACNNEDEYIKAGAIISLENSGSFLTTQNIIQDIKDFSSWTSGEREKLYSIAVENSQVRFILSDYDIARFYKSLLKNEHSLSKNAQLVSKIIGK